MKHSLKKNFWSDVQIQTLIGVILRVGVLLSSFIALTGGVIYLIRHGSEVPAYSVFRDESGIYGSFSKVIEGSLTFHGREIIQLGLMVLIATPVARIFFSALGFLFEKDWLYVGISLVVLGIIAFSMLGHLAG